MIRITENFSLKDLNTFGIAAKARYYTEITSPEQLQELFQDPLFKNNRRLILGGGSNILFTRDFDGIVVKTQLKGIKIVKNDEDSALIEASSGENWHDLVLFCIGKGYGGIENLSLIPGTAGAAPIQNIGAYGVELKDVAVNVSGFDLIDNTFKTFNSEECSFGYRESIFKHELKDRFFISSVTLKLTKTKHALNIQYGAIRDVLSENKIAHPGIKDISDAVISIRKSKLPDPQRIGNAGSFFKNPTISVQHFEQLKQQHPSIPSYPVDLHSIKVPAGWLIEQCGWKGKRINDIGVHPMQALVLVNYGNGKGDELLQLAKDIQESVKSKFNIDLSMEVNIV